MNDGIVRNDGVNFSSFIVDILQTFVASPKSCIKHHTSLVNKVRAACVTGLLFLVFINIRPTLDTSWNKILVILWRFLWDFIKLDFLPICWLNETDLLSAVRTILIEFPPSPGTFNTAKFMFAVQNSIIVIKLVETNSTDFHWRDFVFSFWEWLFLSFVWFTRILFGWMVWIGFGHGWWVWKDYKKMRLIWVIKNKNTFW